MAVAPGTAIRPSSATSTPVTSRAGTDGAATKSLALPITEDDISLSGAIRNLFFKARAHRRPLVQQWQRNYKLLRNRTWVTGRADWLPSPEVPEIYPIVTTMVGWMTDQRPMMDVQPAIPSGTPYYSFWASVAQDLQYAMYGTYTNNKWSAEIEKTLWDGWVYGTGIIKSVWDNTLDKGLGNAALRHVDVFTFYPDPDATCMEDANYFIEARTISAQELERRYPNAPIEDLVAGWETDTDKAPNRLQETGQAPKANPGAISPNTAPRYGLPGQGRVSATDSPGITLFEAWLREHDIMETEDGEVIVYDCWRVVVIAGNCVLMNERANDIWDHGRHPYSRYVVHETGEFWGYSMVEMLAPAQLSLNRILAAMQLNVELTGNPIFKESTRAGIGRTKMDNRPGRRLTINDGGTAEWLNPPQLPATMSELIRFYISEMERVSGMSAITRGNVPTARNSEDALDKIQDAGFVRIRMALRNLEYTLRDAFMLCASNIVQFYDVPRIVSVLGPGGEQGARVLKARNFYLPGKDKESSIPIKYNLLVNAGSEGAISSQQKREDAKVLYAMGAIDDEAILDAFNYPNKEETLKRVRALKESGLMQPPGARQRAGRTS